MDDVAGRARLAAWIAQAAGTTSVAIDRLERMSGGAVQENWALDLTLDGAPLALVLRTTAPGAVTESRTRADEWALLRAARSVGVSAPEPLWLCTDPAITGRAFLVMRRLAGIAAGHRLIRNPFIADDRTALVAELGRQLARIHRITPDSHAAAPLGFLGKASFEPASALVRSIRHYLDGRGDAHPALEWGLRWLDQRARPTAEPVLAHRDFRTGNYMVDETGLTGILDWEFAGWSDPHEDLGWFCAKCWRFGAAPEAGGMASRAAFYGGYEAESGRVVDPELVTYWEVMAHARWAAITLQQAERHLSGAQPSLELALTGRITDALELDILAMTGG